MQRITARRNCLLFISTFVVVVATVTSATTTTTTTTTNCVIDNNATTTTTNGGRPGYHSPSPTDTYLPDCLNPLKRELWRVFQQEDGTAYIIPRPDGLGSVYGICNGTVKEEGIVDKANQYGLCDDNFNMAAINHMDPEDALLFVNIFHRQLQFVADGQNIQPLALDSDILDACELLLLLREKGDDDDEEEDAWLLLLHSYCQALKNNKCNSFGECNDIMVLLPSETQALQIASALNELYGIIPEIGTTTTQEACDPDPRDSCPMAKCAAAPQGCNYVFDHYEINQEGNCCPKMCYAVDSTTGNECSIEHDLVGSKCDPEQQRESTTTTILIPCAVAQCAPPPKGCHYVLDHYVITDAGNCCAKNCFAVDSQGNNCSSSASHRKPLCLLLLLVTLSFGCFLILLLSAVYE